MQDPRHDIPEDSPKPAVGRRKFLLGTVVAGTAAWAVPAIITMEPAGAAALTSPPPAPPEVEVEDKQVLQPGTAAVAASAPARKPEVEVRGALAMTGAPIDTLAAAGFAAVAGGGALHTWSARSARRADAADLLPPVPPTDIPPAPAA